MRPGGKSPEGPPFQVEHPQNLQASERTMQQMDNLPMPIYTHGQEGPIRPPPVPPGNFVAAVVITRAFNHRLCSF